MKVAAVFGFLLALVNVVDSFYTVEKKYKLVFGISVSSLTILPMTISLVWAVREIWVHPLSKFKFMAFGISKYFLADTFQAFINHAITNKDFVLNHILYSDPLTREFKRLYYSYAHVINCDDIDHNGGLGDKHDESMMNIEGAYNSSISIRGHRLCIVDMSRIWNKDFYHEKWEVEANYCLYLDVGSYEKHKVLNDATARVVENIIEWWSVHPEKSPFKTFDPKSMRAECPSLYDLYCVIDDNIAEKHKVINVGDYVHIG